MLTLEDTLDSPGDLQEDRKFCPKMENHWVGPSPLPIPPAADQPNPNP